MGSPETAAALQVEGLGKRFRLGADRADLFTSRLANFFTGRRGTNSERDLWALRDVSFSVAPGEVVGVIGHNGAGKSTLLKLLTRVTRPSEGRFEVAGRVGSLLEVGTGFHPELTGRENVFLNGAVLGMSRSEVRKRFDEIVAFAGVERFLETPVKRYSSGMSVRLAFAVAAHLDAELLLIDEVLTVGDAAFQRKCVEKVRAICRDGRSAIVVSHELDRVASLCGRVLLLERGRLAADGRPEDVIAKYRDRGGLPDGTVVWSDDDAPGDDAVRIVACAVRQRDRGGDPTGRLDRNLPAEIEICFRVLEPGLRVMPALWLADASGTPVLASAASPAFADGPPPEFIGPGEFVARCVIPADLLNEREYVVTPLVNEHPWRMRAVARDALRVAVRDGGGDNDGFAGEWYGAVRTRLTWSKS